MRIGYARVSMGDQNLDLQLDALKKAGCEKVFCDKMTGGRFDRPGLQEALAYLRDDQDALVIWRLDRLGRTVKGVITLVEELAARNIDFLSLTDNIDTSSPSGRFFFHVMASLNQLEKETTRLRTMAGLQAARDRGRIGGRKRKMTPGKIEAAKQLLASGTLPKDVADSIGVSIPTLYRWVPASGRS